MIIIARSALVVCCCLLAFFARSVPAQTDPFSECVLELIKNSASDVTVGEIRETCRAQDGQEEAR